MACSWRAVEGRSWNDSFLFSVPEVMLLLMMMMIVSDDKSHFLGCKNKEALVVGQEWKGIIFFVVTIDCVGRPSQWCDSFFSSSRRSLLACLLPKDGLHFPHPACLQMPVARVSLRFVQ
jgi:hypothetical protein